MFSDPVIYRRPLAVLLCLAAAAGALAAQEADERPVQRHIRVVFNDDEAVTEKEVWVDDGEGPVLLGGGPGEHLMRLPWGFPRAFLGVQLLDITPDLRQHFGATAEAGVLVSAVVADGPAAAAGIQVGDVLTTIDGAELADSGGVLRRLADRQQGETVTVGLVRARRSLSLDVTLEERPRPQVDLAPMFWTPGDGERRVLRLPHRVIEIEEGDLDEAISELSERLESPEWRRKLEETTSRRLSLENRIRELEERLREMEKRLSADPP